MFEERTVEQESKNPLFAKDILWKFFYEGWHNFNYSIEEIAHRLANINRYCGGRLYQINVALHSVCVSLMVSESNRPQALMHELTECVIGDINGVFKKTMPEIGVKEKEMQAIILPKYGVSGIICDEVNWADKKIQEYELASKNEQWLKLPIFDGTTMRINLKVVQAEESEKIFLKEYNKLFANCK